LDVQGQTFFDISKNLVDCPCLTRYCVGMRKLQTDTAAELLARLGNPTRLRIVRELVRVGKTGMAVGDIQRSLKIPHSTLSHHLSLLRNVGLLWQEREGTVLRCFIDYDRLGSVITYLTEDCCAGETPATDR
jgi:ArsR family transcriptional regulator